MPLEIPELRTIRVYIELDLVEGEDFNSDQQTFSDEYARELAETSFISMINDINVIENGIDLKDYVQSRIIEPPPIQGSPITDSN